jgi:signal transduction histidine kinase
MPAYWLREVLKILLDNGKRAARLQNEKPKEKERLVRMEARYCKSESAGKLEIIVSNQGKAVPEAHKEYLIKSVIPRHLREEHGGRGIGLFMSGLILEAHEGSLSYEPQNEETRFVLRLPITTGQ